MNYWLLFIEFLNYFKDISYKGIPLPLLSQFTKYLNSQINHLMTDKNIREKFAVSFINPVEIQPYFDDVIHLIQKADPRKDKNGQVVIHPFVIRLPEQTYSQYFPKNKTTILSNGNRGFPSDYSCIYLDINAHLTEDSKKNILVQVKERFNTLKEHPIFSVKHFQETFLQEIPDMIDFLEAVDQFLHEHSVACFILGTTETMLPRAIALAGIKYGIPSICMQHGNIGVEAGFMPTFATKYAVHGDIEKQWYMNRGVKEKVMEVTGHPRFDLITTSQYLSKEAFNQVLKLNPDRKNITLITQPGQEKAFAEIAEKLAALSNANIIIKPHPTEVIFNKCNLYFSLSQKYPDVKVVTDQVMLYDVLSNSDLIVVTTSTAGLEALLFKKTIVILDIFQDKYYKASGILKPYIFPTIDLLIQGMNQLLHSDDEKKQFDQKRIEFLKIAYPKSRSGEQISKLINKIIIEDT